MSNKEIAVFYIGNDDLIGLLATSMASVCYNTKKLIHFYILDCGVNTFHKSQIEGLKKKFDNFILDFLPVDLDIFKNIKKYKGFSDFWTKLLIPQICPHLDKAIYLDTDTIALNDINEFWEQDLKGFAIGAVPATYYDTWRHNIFKKYYPIGKNFLFINTGTLLIDCKQWREKYIFSNVMNLIKKYNNVLDQAVGFDEIILSVYFENNFKVLNCRFNSTDHKNTLKDFNSNYSDDYVNNEWKHVVIRHFAGYDKPWVDLYNEYNGEIIKNYSAFWFFARMTPFFGGLWNCFLEKLTQIRFNQKNNLLALQMAPSENHTKKLKYYLFGFIPLLKIKQYPQKTKIYTLGFIPLLKIKKQPNKVKFYLFGFIPLFKIKNNK